jgi:hypothetical protein
MVRLLEIELSYESQIFKQLALPSREDVIRILLTSLFKHNGRVKEFGSGDQDFADELADSLNLSNVQRTFQMETIVRKEGRLKKFPAWNRLLFRAADIAAKEGLLARPKETLRLTGNREWMLTERGIDQALHIMRVPIVRKQELPVVTYEVQRIKNKLENAHPPRNYTPVDTHKKSKAITRESLLRDRGFRQSIVQAYDFACCICGLKVTSPDSLVWEVEAAHIVPHRFFGKDDIWNGMALCHFHHWSFDVGWFTLRQDFTIEVSVKLGSLPLDYGLMGSFDILREGMKENQHIRLPKKDTLVPHESSISWHRQHIFANDKR